MVIEAVVIKTSPFREHDRLVTLFSRQSGKLSALAKGSLRSRSVQALHLDAGNLIHCELVPGKAGMPIMTGTQAIRCFSGMKSSPILSAAGSFFLQIIDTVVYGQEPDEPLWSSLTSALAGIDAAQESEALAVFRSHQATLLGVLGYGNGRFNGSGRAARTDIDDFIEQLADRRLKTLDLFFELAG